MILCHQSKGADIGQPGSRRQVDLTSPTNVRSFLTIFFSLTLMIADSCAAGKGAFAGLWGFEAGDVTAFSLDLTQNGSRVQGYHTAVAHHGKRVDAVLPNEGKPSITGDVIAGVAHVHFRSGYSNATGDATLTPKGKKLEWTIIRATGAHYLPASCILSRQ